jgi:hypothetical protein
LISASSLKGRARMEEVKGCDRISAQESCFMAAVTFDTLKFVDELEKSGI